MNQGSMLFFADRLPPLIGGMEMHARYFIEYFSEHVSFPLIGTITKTNDGNDFLISKQYKDAIDITKLPEMFKPAIVFFNSGRWIEELGIIRQLFPSTIFLYRTGGNEILKAPLEQQNISDHKLRQAYWVSSLNSSIDLIITNSAFTEARLSAIGIKCPFVRCIGGVNTTAIKQKSFNHKNSTLRIFNAARFVPYKNHHLLLAVFHELILRGYDISLRLAGDGPLLDDIKELVIRYKLESTVEFLGAIDNEAVCEEIANADVYMQFSSDYLTRVPGGEYIHTEGMGRSILEAVSAGTFVIAGKCGALPEIVIGDKGFLVELTDVIDIVDRIEPILKKLPIQLPFIKDYSWQNLFGNYEKLLLRLVN